MGTAWSCRSKVELTSDFIPIGVRVGTIVNLLHNLKDVAHVGLSILMVGILVSRLVHFRRHVHLSCSLNRGYRFCELEHEIRTVWIW